ncbi:MAG TPA: macro domain-containing protein [Thermomicrobiales bacterium]|jgi:O-acetyl-ADP-ribose deacetylase (regulator of RNase III)|nr:macro domain-containing protein [Thermomicrobiales bacterium]
MTADEQPGDAVRYGRTTVRVVEGRLVEQSADALVITANARGILGMGGIRLVAGADVEREAMAGAPLAIGSAIMTGPGQLESRGVRAILHCVVSETLGGSARSDDVRRAIPAALRLADERRFTSLAMPLIGASGGTSASEDLVMPAAVLVVEEIVAHLRRISSRIERITLVVRTADEVDMVSDVLLLAREQAWELPR